jgi:dipeptidyl-peptidase 4
MRFARLAVIGAVFALVVIASWPVSTAPAPAATYQQFLSPASPLELAAAKKADRIAWIAFEEGKRNAYAAAAPAFAPVRLTRFLKDDGIDMSDVQISDDGSVVTFIRGTVPNRDGWVANPRALQEERRSALPNCQEQRRSRRMAPRSSSPEKGRSIVRR